MWLWQLVWLMAIGLPCPKDFVDVQQLIPTVEISMPYATSNNVTGQVIYPLQRCLLRREVAQRLAAVQKALEAHDKALSLLLWDCYRPMASQHQLYQAVAGSRKAGYITDPNGTRAPVHTYGAAVDVSIWHRQRKQPLAMGTDFDVLGPLAEPRREQALLAQGLLEPQDVRHRQLLRRLMVDVGRFRAIPNEWWHFDAWQGQALRQRYQSVDVPLDCTFP